MPPDSATPAAPRRRYRLAGLVLGVAAVAVVVAGLASRSSDASKLRERAEAQSVPTVVVISPGKAPAATTLELPGRIEAHARAPIHARVSGYLKRWYADIGARVKAGQLLAEIETPDLDQQLLQARAELANAKANAALAETTAKRWESLLTTGTVSRQGADEKAGDMVAKRSLVNALQANVDRIEATKRFARIVAPFDGIVTSRSTDVGALINVGSATGTELFVISDTKKVRVYVNVPQAWAGAIEEGTKASLRVPERRGKVHAATVQSLSQSISATSGSMLVQLAVDNADSELLPGGFASVTFQLPAARDALTIPPSALLFDKAGLRVATVDADSKVVLKPVTVARDTGTVIEIASGLSAEDRLVESPPDGIASGDKVRIAVAEPKKAPVSESPKR